MAATHHSLLNDAVFFSLLLLLLLPLLFCGSEGEDRVWPAPYQTGSYRVHNLQVGPSSSSSREMFACLCDHLVRSFEDYLWIRRHFEDKI